MQPFLEIEDLHVKFDASRGQVNALNGVNLQINEGETFGLVGESGCGKSLTALSITGLLPHTAKIQGRIVFDGTDMLRLNERELSKFRASEMAIVFQDPSSALDPLFTIESQVSEPFLYHKSSRLDDSNGKSTRISKKLIHEKVIGLLDLVRLPDPETVARSYPHQLSGGMKQRVMIAIALALNPKLLILDEPTTALDVTIQDEILSLLKDIKSRIQTTIVLITHDFGVVAEMCDRVAVMYAGEVMEIASTRELLVAPRHPYTKALLGSVPNLSSKLSELEAIKGVVPSLLSLPKGCLFEDRCPVSMSVCTQVEPDMIQVIPGHKARCHLYAQTESGHQSEREGSVDE